MRCRLARTRLFIWVLSLAILAIVIAGSVVAAERKAGTSIDTPVSTTSAKTLLVTSTRPMAATRPISRDGHSVVADVRLKVRMRLRVCLGDIRKDARPGGKLLPVFGVAETNKPANDALRAHYREWVAREFPGCRIEFTRKNIYIHLPDRYEGGRAPVMEQMPIDLIAVFHPTWKGDF